MNSNKKKEYINRVLNEYRNIELIELRYENITSNKILYKDSSLDNIEIIKEAGYMVRVVNGDNVIQIKFNELNKLKTHIKNAVKLLEEVTGLNTKAESREYYHHNTFAKKSNFTKIIKNNKWKNGYLSNYNKLINDISGGTIKCEINFNDKIGHKEYFNNKGACIVQSVFYYTCMFIFKYVTKETQNQNILLCGERNYFNKFKNLHKAIRNKIKSLTLKKSIKKVRDGYYDLLMSPEIAALFIHETIGHMLEADHLYNSEFSDYLKIGNRISSKKLNVIDDPTIPNLTGSFVYDDEGVKSKKKYLIKNGIVNDYLGNIEYSKKMAEDFSGNARALSINNSPIIRMSNTYIEPTSTDKENMFNKIEKGLYVKGILGGDTNEEIFYFHCAEAYLIKDGKIREVINGVTINGSIFEALRKIKEIFNDFRWIDGGGCGKMGQNPLPVAIGSPHILLENYKIGG